jgi:hypothetical protein
MTAKLVPTVRTQYTQYELVKALVEAWKEMFGVLPNKKQVGVIWAQNALETGQSAAMWGNNWGNLKYSGDPAKDSDDILYQMLSNTWEIENGKKIIYQPPHRATWFRAFPTLREGVIDHLKLLKERRYKSAWPAIEAGDPILFVKKIREMGYFTASLEDYTKAEIFYFNKYMNADFFEKAIKDLCAPEIVPVLPDRPIIRPSVDLPKVEDKEIPDDGPLQLTKWQKAVDFLTSWMKK